MSEWKKISEGKKPTKYLVYQPEHEAGRSRLSPRIVLNSQAGWIRQSTHWMPLPPPPAPTHNPEKEE